MPRLIKLHLIFLTIALLIAFLLIPVDQYFFENLSVDDVKKYYREAFNFSSAEAWKKVFTWFLGLTCGRLMLKALSGK